MHKKYMEAIHAKAIKLPVKHQQQEGHPHRQQGNEKPEFSRKTNTTQNENDHPE